MGFCGFSISGQKPDATTLERFRDKLSEKGTWKKLLSKINRLLEREGLKIGDGGYMIADATPVSSSRRPRKTYTAESNGTVSGPEYSDDSDALWVKKAGKICYGYAATLVTNEQGMVEVLVRVENGKTIAVSLTSDPQTNYEPLASAAYPAARSTGSRRLSELEQATSIPIPTRIITVKAIKKVNFAGSAMEEVVKLQKRRLRHLLCSEEKISDQQSQKFYDG